MQPQTDNTIPTDFKIGDKVKDLSGIEGTVIENQSSNYFIRVDFPNGGWRDLKAENLKLIPNKVESLKDVAKKHYEIGGYDQYANGTMWIYSSGAKLGADWQKEQYKPLVEVLTKISKGERYTLDEINKILDNIKP